MLLRSRRLEWQNVREFEEHFWSGRMNRQVDRDTSLAKVSEPWVRPTIGNDDSIEIVYVRKRKSFVRRIGFQDVVSVFGEEFRYRMWK